MLVIFCASVVGGGILCVVLPESYRSSTLILVESQKIPENYVQAIIGPTIEERLNSLQQQLMSRTVLTQMIQEFGLYPDDVRQNGVDRVLDRLRKDIRVTTMTASATRGGIDAFAISYAHENPMIAMKVTAKLASHFIEENLKVREQLVEGASEFLEQELSLAKDRLEGQERAISQFKTKYMGELPEQVETNLSALDRLQLQQGTTHEALQKVSDRLTLMDRMIKEYESPNLSAGPVQNPGGAVMVDPLVLRLKELEKNLTTLSAEYKDSYPDIAFHKQEIQSLKAQLKDKKDKKEKVGEKDESEKSSVSTKDSKPTDLYLRELLRQRDEARLEIASLRDRLVRIKEQVKEYELRIEKVPMREQELMILVRDYNNLKENYRTILDKKLNARLAENLEKRQKGEQFRIIDPANLPGKPEKPDRLFIMLVSLALGCGLGAGSAITLESWNPVFRRSDDVESLLQLKVLASIPSFKNSFQGVHKVSQAQVTTTPSAKGMIGRWLPGHTSVGVQSGSEGAIPNLGGRGLPALEVRRLSSGMDITRELPLIGKWSPWSIAAEQFRVAATRLALLQSTLGGNVTVITSAVKGEGKSSVAANLAYSLARDMGKLTLLVDADLKCPTIHQFMGIPRSPGLRDVFRRTKSVDSCLYQEGELPLWILPSGLEVDRTFDLSKVNQIAGIISEVKAKYDYIIVDAPPILPLADMHVLAGMANILALVVRAGMTPRTIVESALRALDATTNLFIILNGLEASGTPYYMQEGYEYLLEGKETGYK